MTRKDGPLGSFEIRNFVDLGSASTQRMVTEGPAAAGSANQYVSEYLDGFGRTEIATVGRAASASRASATRHGPAHHHAGRARQRAL